VHRSPLERWHAVDVQHKIAVERGTLWSKTNHSEAFPRIRGKPSANDEAHSAPHSSTAAEMHTRAPYLCPSSSAANQIFLSGACSFPVHPPRRCRCDTPPPTMYHVHETHHHHRQGLQHRLCRPFLPFLQQCRPLRIRLQHCTACWRRQKCSVRVAGERGCCAVWSLSCPLRGPTTRACLRRRSS